MREHDRSGCVLAALLVLAFLVMLLAACGSVRIEGECTYERIVSTSYTCAPTGKVEHIRVAPAGGPPEP